MSSSESVFLSSELFEATSSGTKTSKASPRNLAMRRASYPFFLSR